MTSFSNHERSVIQLPFPEGQYQICLASGTSLFSGSTREVVVNLDRVRAEEPVRSPKEQFWRELLDAEYQLIASDAIFTINSVETRGVLSGVTPTLHLELKKQDFPEPTYGDYVVLIFDNNDSTLIDWVIPSPIGQASMYFTPTDNQPAIYFEIPLLPTNQEAAPNHTKDDTLSVWRAGDELTFGIFFFNHEPSFSDALDFHWFHYRHPYRYQSSNYLFSKIQSLAEKADRFLKHHTQGNEQFQKINRDGVISVGSAEQLAEVRGRSLLFCHGILSSTHDAFHELFDDSNWFPSLWDCYAGNIFAWDHYTLSKHTACNAENLIDILQNLHDVDMDIICHSRGAGVVRNLLENPTNRQLLNNKNIRVNSVIFVAGACLGSQLASAQNTNRLFRRLNMLFYFLGGTPGGLIKAMLIIIKLLVAIAHRFPGVESMDPQGDPIITLNSFNDTVAREYLYIRANYDPAKLPLKLADEYLWDKGVFNGAANDLVVPYEGAGSSNKYLTAYGKKIDILNYDPVGKPQSVVWHINFFVQQDVKKLLASHLCRISQ